MHLAVSHLAESHTNLLLLALLLALLIGIVAGLRSLTAPAVVAWAAFLHWINLSGHWLSWVGSLIAVIIFLPNGILGGLSRLLPFGRNQT